METSITSLIKNTIKMKARRILTLFSLVLLSLSDVLCVAPSWVAGTPSVATTGPLSITMNYGINQVGTVYIVVFNYNNVVAYSSAQIRTFALAGPSGTIVATAAIPV